jgi:hypothetical protein
MRTSSIFILGLATNALAFNPQQVLSALDLPGSSYQCDNGVYIRVTVPPSIANSMQVRSQQLFATMHRLINTTALVLVPTASSLTNLSILSPPPPTEAATQLSTILNARPKHNSVLSVSRN